MKINKNLVGLPNYTQQKIMYHNADSPLFQRRISQSPQKILLFNGQYYNPTKGVPVHNSLSLEVKAKMFCYAYLFLRKDK